MIRLVDNRNSRIAKIKKTFHKEKLCRSLSVLSRPSTPRSAVQIEEL